MLRMQIVNHAYGGTLEFQGVINVWLIAESPNCVVTQLKNEIKPDIVEPKFHELG